MPGSTTRRRIVAATPGGSAALRALAGVLSVFVLLALPSAASAAVNGQLKQLPGTLGCLAKNVAGCGNLNDPITNVGKPALSPDGLHLYVPDRGSSSLAVFDRDPATGALTEKGCFSFAAIAGANCTVVGVSPLQGATAAAVSSDGKSLYVVGPSGGAAAGIAHFTLAANGTPSYDSCFNGNATTTCGGMPIFNGANPSSVVAVDTTSVYVGTRNASVVVFKRNPTTGSLNQVGYSNAEKCLRPAVDGNNCTPVAQLATVTDLAVTPDNKQILVAAPDCGNLCSYVLIALDRNASTGALTRHPGPAGCIAGLFGDATCAVRNLQLGSQITISPDGRRIYVANRPVCCPGYSAVMLVTRDPSSGDLSPVTDWCIEAPGATTDCAATAKSLVDVGGIAVGPNGDFYNAGLSGQRIGIFDVNPGNGRLSPKPGVFGCLASVSQADGCGGTLVQGGNMEWIVPSRDGRFVYGMGAGRIFSFAVDHAPVCRNMPLTTAFNTAITIKLDCTRCRRRPDHLYEAQSTRPRASSARCSRDGTITYGPLVRLGRVGLVPRSLQRRPA